MIRHRSRRIVCLDFSRDQLTLVEVTEDGITAWGTRPLPEALLRNGDPVEPETLGELLRQSLALAGSQATRARMAIPDEATVSRHVTLPRMPRRELGRAMRFAAERHIPFPIDRACWSWDVIDEGPDRLRVYLVAAWRDVVEHYAQVARSAGLEPEVLEPRSVAVARAVDQDQALLVDAGARSVHLTLLVDGQPVFVDEQATGPGQDDQREVLDRLLQRAFRYQSTATRGTARLAPVLLAGDLETADVKLSVAGGPVTQVLNGQLPAAPPGFRAGGYLANLGLAMRVSR